jgi:uncharacterized protein (DUF1778 family)
MERERIQVYADRETKRRVELAAAKRDIAVTQYCLEAIEQQLLEEGVLEEQSVEIPVEPVSPAELMADLRSLGERILARRGGRPIDLDIVEQVRAERDDEIAGLC